MSAQRRPSLRGFDLVADEKCYYTEKKFHPTINPFSFSKVVYNCYTSSDLDKISITKIFTINLNDLTPKRNLGLHTGATINKQVEISITMNAQGQFSRNFDTLP